jgi:selenocysteine-specific translation elongation factor
MSGVAEQNFVVGILGDDFELRQLVGQAIGSPGTKSDIMFFNRLDSAHNHVFCALTPVEYPEKVKPFLQTLSISNIHVLVIDPNKKLNAVIGETLVGMDLYHKLYHTESLIVIAGVDSKNEWALPEMKNKLLKILSTTSLKATKIIDIRQKTDYETVKAEIIERGLKLSNDRDPNKEYTKVMIDHAFPVKGIGTVILGVVDKGEVHAGQLVEIIGYEDMNKKVIIKSIQKQDRNFKTAGVGDRVGLALKGNISADQISRDNLITSQGKFTSENNIKAILNVNQFYKPKGGSIKPNDGIQYFGLVDLKSSPLKFISGDEIFPGKSGKTEIQFDKRLFHDGTGLSGIITEMNKFNGSLRIVGHFQQISD